jgi:hypothetical protein
MLNILSSMVRTIGISRENGPFWHGKQTVAVFKKTGSG